MKRSNTAPSFLLALALGSLGFAACATAPKPAPAPVVEAPKPVEPPLALTGLTRESQGLTSAELKLSGHVGNENPARELSWTAKVGEREVGAGTTTLPGAGDFTLALPVTLVTGAADLATTGETTQSVDVTAKLGEATESRSVAVYTVRAPEAKVVQVQVSPEEEGTALTFLFALKNGNAFEVAVDKVDYVVAVGGRQIVKDSLPGAKVPASGDVRMEVPALLNAATAGGAKELKALLAAGPELPASISGTLKLGALELPFQDEKTVTIRAANAPAKPAPVKPSKKK